MARSSDPTRFTIAEARDALAAKDISARELAQAHVDAVARARTLNAFITETPDHALSRAAQSDARIAAGEARPLEGIPLAIKDSVLHPGCAHHGGEPHPGQFRPHL